MVCSEDIDGKELLPDQCTYAGRLTAYLLAPSLLFMGHGVKHSENVQASTPKPSEEEAKSRRRRRSKELRRSSTESCVDSPPRRANIASSSGPQPVEKEPGTRQRQRSKEPLHAATGRGADCSTEISEAVRRKTFTVSKRSSEQPAFLRSKTSVGSL